MAKSRPAEGWNSQLGIILAVSGSAVGLGNFLRFPGNVAEFGGGAFMIAYFLSFLLLGLPICWAEWAMGRYGGAHGAHSTAGIFTILFRNPKAKYLGVIGVLIPVCIYMYYVVIESWCLGYALNFLAGNMEFTDVDQSGSFLGAFIGAGADGSAFSFAFSLEKVGWLLVFCFLLNFYLIYRGLSKGIEWFCKLAVPTLMVLALVILVRVLTLGTPDPSEPQRNISNGLGFMWNPTKVYLEQQVTTEDGAVAWTLNEQLVGPRRIAEGAELAAADPAIRMREVSVAEQLLNPDLWLAAAGQIFFSLSIGFGIILVYSSYLGRKEDVVLSGLAASSANEFAEVGIGGLLTIPAGVAFLGVTALSAFAGSTFGLGFQVLPLVFAQMPLGNIFGFLFFFLLFLAAVTSSLSMVQPGIAFLEEALDIGRKRSVAILGFITAIGSLLVVYFSKDVKMLDTLDFWVGTFSLFILATIEIITFSWVFGAVRGREEANFGAAFSIPRWFNFIFRWVCPIFLLTIFSLWALKNVFGIAFKAGADAAPSIFWQDLFIEPNPVAWMAIAVIVLLAGFVALVLSSSTFYNKLLEVPEPERAKEGV
jgi:SNF family Na+-dependent transporter